MSGLDVGVRSSDYLVPSAPTLLNIYFTCIFYFVRSAPRIGAA